MVECPNRPCPVCGKPLSGRQKTGCSGKCRAEASRKRRQREMMAALDEAERMLRRARLFVLRD